MSDTEEQSFIELQGTEGSFMAPYILRRSKKAKRILLSIGLQNEVVLTVPWNTSFSDGVDFLKAQGNWIENQLNQSIPLVPLNRYLLKKPKLYGLGKTWSLEIRYEPRQRPGWLMDEEFFLVDFMVSREKDFEEQIVQLVRKFADKVLKVRTEYLAFEQGLECERVTVRDQKGRWGSCSCSGTISLNWRLVLMPSKLQDHIIYHELSHLKEMNHSPAFYDLLGNMDSQADENASKVNELSKELMNLGRL